MEIIVGLHILKSRVIVTQQKQLMLRTKASTQPIRVGVEIFTYLSISNNNHNYRKISISHNGIYMGIYSRLD